MTRKEIEKALRETYNLVGTTGQVDVIEYLLKRPGTPPIKTWKGSNTLTSKRGTQEIIQKFKTLGILSKSNHVLLKNKASQLKQPRLPKHILDHQLPNASYKYVHIAAILANCSDEEVLEGKYFKGLTKAKVIEAMKRDMNSKPHIIEEIMYGVQDKLALFAIYVNDLEAFKDMQGTITLPESE